MSDDIYIHNVEQELIQDLIDNFSENYETIETNLSNLIAQPDELQLIDTCFRSIHSIKSNATVCELDPIVSLSQAIEDVIYSIKTQKIIFNDTLCDVILISLDRLKEIMFAVIDQTSIATFQRDEIQKRLTEIAKSRGDGFNEHAQSLIELITGRFNPASQADEPAQEVKTKAEPESKTLKPEPVLIEPKKEPQNPVEEFEKYKPDENKLSKVMADDLKFFRMLASKIDKKNPAWTDRTQQLIDLALKMNESAGTPIDPNILTAAVCLHDIGMAFIPNHIMFKKGKLSKDEVNVINRHTFQGAVLAKRLLNWNGVETIIQQHHERPDGKGYPEGLKGASISDGAKVMAIVDAFYSMTNKRSDREHKRSFIRGISEINACSGTQFAQNWVEHFNAVMLNKDKRDAVAQA
ncbi:MAG: HD domain-containing protein [Gammaproteobacteria bacterium]|nr:MAG: HD domain-containing protein [Gammaproteobacteria bacterium]